jgi:excisionase family DNA binding protein
MIEQSKIERSTLTVIEAALYLGISKNLMYQLVRENRIPAIRIGRRILFKRDSIDRWLSNQEGLLQEA